MDATRWKRIQRAFDAVIETPESLRSAALCRICGNDEGLRLEVEALLRSSADAPPVFEAPVINYFDDDPDFAAGSDGISDFETQEQACFVGRRLGAYEISDVLGRGGMGTVYRAERVDGQFRKVVAIKVAHRACADEEACRLFHRERRALALLEHPNIARLLDAGVSHDGLPYVVMELVDGVPIDAYCSRNRLDLVDLLRLFRNVCEAVDHAHRHLIVHRDLKPANILVTKEGMPKLLDFGIAKLLHSDDEVDNETHTFASRRPMTPGFASPEQIRGEQMTTASDVYSLGVVLYELLTGQSPYGHTDLSVESIEQRVLDTQPLLPSDAASRRGTDTVSSMAITPVNAGAATDASLQKLSRRLRGDIDNIVMMALRKEPERRYATVRQFADDIDNYLESRPVRARPERVGYRLSKLIRRHAFACMAAGLIAISLTIGIIGTVWQARSAAFERDEAVAANQRADATLRFLENMLATVDPAVAGRDVRVIQVLDAASDQVEREHADQPAIRASLHDVIGQTYFALGEAESAERHLRAAVDLHSTVSGPAHRDTIASVNALCVCLYHTAQLEESRTRLEDALRVCRESPEDIEVLTAQTQNNLAAVLSVGGQADRAEELFREALATRRRRLEAGHLDIAETLNNLARLEAIKGRYGTAVDLLDESIEIRRARLTSDHPLVIQSMTNLGVLLAKQGRRADAESTLEKTLTDARRVLGPDHPDFERVQERLTAVRQLAGTHARDNVGRQPPP
ncbi:MAG: serine/threonine protein kinase [Phycisphaerales bacterium]|nr:serine/threonine protein kinase [Phycisphaerales bacterium]MCB9864757.1 serine/threonine protein kinase [Phycisphaerales bacterium]